MPFTIKTVFPEKQIAHTAILQLTFPMGESLFTLFASLAYAIQFLMELQTYHF